jgi:adenosylcobinamide kinase/adenosylcobinamide-phosphate guanylyltransferase
MRRWRHASKRIDAIGTRAGASSRSLLRSPRRCVRAVSPESLVIVDCLTVWLSNLVCGKDADASRRETQALLDALSSLAGDCILISNEVGFGIIPANALARRFGDEAGVLHQRVAARCDRVILMVAGLPLAVKESPGISGPGVPP